ncbi:Protein of unknown function [Gryllus bimaculatus]|nr:Protein of unknown function [Gryllus bimaculatus]
MVVFSCLTMSRGASNGLAASGAISGGNNDRVIRSWRSPTKACERARIESDSASHAPLLETKLGNNGSTGSYS